MTFDETEMNWKRNVFKVTRLDKWHLQVHCHEDIKGWLEIHLLNKHWYKKICEISNGVPKGDWTLMMMMIVHNMHRY